MDKGNRIEIYFKDVRISFQLVKKSLYNEEHCEDKTANHLHKFSCPTCSSIKIK